MLILSLFSALLFAEEQLQRGVLIDRVECSGKPGQSYALYLPSGYNAEKAWPILYVFDPRERGSLAAGRFVKAAEKYGVILASSNNTRSDDPTWPNWDAIQAMWEDTHQRLRVDNRRIYATGFSGGARLAWGLGYIFPENVAGVIGCGGGAHPERPPTKETSFAFYGIAGKRDFNHLELMQLDRDLEKLKIPHRFASFDGRHEWPPEPVATGAIEWMELRAMADGLKEKDAEWITLLYQSRFSDAEALEKEGRPYEAYIAYRELSADFDGLRDVPEAQQKIARLRDEPEVMQAEKEHEKRHREESDYRRTIVEVISRLLNVESIPPSAGEIEQQLRVKPLKDRIAKQAGSEDALAAQRMLESAKVQMQFYLPTQFRARKDYVRTILCLTIALDIDDTNPVAWYNLACAYARSGNKKKAVESLKRAVDAGFTDASQIGADEDLESIRNEEGYRSILNSIGSGNH